MVRVEVCQDPVAWDRYVESRPNACDYNRWGWRVTQMVEADLSRGGC